MNDRITSYSEYWLYHIGQYRKSGNRVLRYLGLAAAVVLLTLAPVFQIWWPIPLAIACAFVPGMIGHVLIEHSPREKQHYPLWAIDSDMRMLELFLRGRTAREFGCADFGKSNSL